MARFYNVLDYKRNCIYNIDISNRRSVMADNMDLEEKVSEQEEKGIAMEILGELKSQNERLMDFNKKLMNAIKWLIVLAGLIVGGFLLYLYQYDFSGTIEQNGVYTLVDSNGNVISSDITPEQMEDILKIINGENKNNQKEN